jgi:hypothetical protein
MKQGVVGVEQYPLIMHASIAPAYIAVFMAAASRKAFSLGM